MKRTVVSLVLGLFLTAVFAVALEAASWEFHETIRKGANLTVYGTINCQMVEPPLLFQEDIAYCHTISGEVPREINDFLIGHWWKNSTCQNRDFVKVAVGYYDTQYWKLRFLEDWLSSNLSAVGGRTTLPSIGDSTGATQNIYIIVNLDQWMASPQPLLTEYVISNGTSTNLPGYLIGTTPIVFDSTAGPGQDPFSTTPFTGTLWRSGELGFSLPKGLRVPSSSEGGLIALLIALAGTVVVLILRRRIRVRA